MKISLYEWFIEASVYGAVVFHLGIPEGLINKRDNLGHIFCCQVFWPGEFSKDTTFKFACLTEFRTEQVKIRADCIINYVLETCIFVEVGGLISVSFRRERGFQSW